MQIEWNGVRAKALQAALRDRKPITIRNDSDAVILAGWIALGIIAGDKRLNSQHPEIVEHRVNESARDAMDTISYCASMCNFSLHQPLPDHRCVVKRDGDKITAERIG